MSAAVADFRPGVRVLGKLSRRNGKRATSATAQTIALVPNPDLLAELGRARRGKKPYLIGFAAEVGVSGQALVERARRKLAEKACDVVVANEVGRPGIGFGADQNAVTLVFADGRAVELPPARKDVVAQAIWDRIGPELTRAPKLDSKADKKPASRLKGKNA
jgi:phosphopantothenoylcysteine decarboxylase/phosphopantothenate--cysteine ligase